ncbi:helix-turn-helix domain-containing protein [Sphingomonas oryzagri]|uniref:Helix-turn-helix domain-containing protein n=1 Tax=Sphingomonas oryzagri TaxID=3042314 RepID=A0ABT6N2E7_9SPHN|nr:helix-turn-helix domain-containing protein [Sphingomonas oryzagri]MDH7639489.1 helix-turn-helix domain-containing protein [Sphingomonas oryzagri]
MAAKRINPRRIKLHHSYSVEDVARTLGVHKNSVRAWLTKGLAPIDRRRPMLFDGKVLRAFLERQRGHRKRTCLPGTMYCFRCREPRRPALAMVDYVPINAASGNLKALCDTCGTIMHRRARLSGVAAVMPGIAVHMAEASPRLRGCGSASLNCDLAKEA